MRVYFSVKETQKKIGKIFKKFFEGILFVQYTPSQYLFDSSTLSNRKLSTVLTYLFTPRILNI